MLKGTHQVFSFWGIEWELFCSLTVCRVFKHLNKNTRRPTLQDCLTKIQLTFFSRSQPFFLHERPEGFYRRLLALQSLSVQEEDTVGSGSECVTRGACRRSGNSPALPVVSLEELLLSKHNHESSSELTNCLILPLMTDDIGGGNKQHQRKINLRFPCRAKLMKRIRWDHDS